MDHSSNTLSAFLAWRIKANLDLQKHWNLNNNHIKPLLTNPVFFPSGIFSFLYNKNQVSFPFCILSNSPSGSSLDKLYPLQCSQTFLVCPQDLDNTIVRISLINSQGKYHRGNYSQYCIQTSKRTIAKNNQGHQRNCLCPDPDPGTTGFLNGHRTSKSKGLGSPDSRTWGNVHFPPKKSALSMSSGQAEFPYLSKTSSNPWKR